MFSSITRTYLASIRSYATNLSFSRIDCYLTCPYRYKLQYIDNRPVTPTLPMIFGSSLHAGVAEFAESILKEPSLLNNNFQNVQDRVVTAFITYFDAHREILKMQESIHTLDKKRKEGIHYLKRYIRREKPFMYAYVMESVEHEQQSDYDETSIYMMGTLRQPWIIEKKYTISTSILVDNEPLLFTCIFDRIDEETSMMDDTGTYRVIIEYKTHLKKYAMPKHEMQMKLYAWAYTQLFPDDMPVRYCYLTSISTGENEIYIFNRDDLQKQVPELLRSTATAIAEKKFPAKPNLNNCTYCSFNKSCPFSFINQ
jgi:CRISPR/Cas system-associated exonuclease Cas4 (RecB family)